jgi:hypothetical protein
MELNGLDFDWLNSPVDVRALYECSCGRPHGKWAIFNGIVDDSEALAELKNSRIASSIAAKRKRQEEDKRARKEARECRAAKEYAQAMLEWGRVMQGHNETMQRFWQVTSDISLFCLFVTVELFTDFQHHVNFFAEYGSTHRNASGYDSASPASPSNIWCFSIPEPLS